MIVLSIDSSSKVATAALFSEDTLLGEYVLNNKREHSVILMDMVNDLLADCNLTIDDIDGYIISKGPGSFTGLRIGMATVKGLSFGSNKPYVSISSLKALAYSVSAFNGLICPIVDALRENVYTALFKNVNGNFEKLLDYTPMDMCDLIDLLKQKGEEVLFVGDGISKHREYIEANFKEAKFAPNHLNLVHASSLAELGIGLLKNGVYDNPDSAPIYLKKPQAERELERRLKLNGNKD